MKCFHVPTAYVLPFTHRKGRLQWLTSVWMFLSTLLVHSDYSNLQSLYKFLKKRGRTSTMIWALRVWGISSALLLATAFLVSLQLWCHVEAVRSSRFEPSRTMSFVSVMDIREQFHGRNSLMYSDRSTGLLSFEEAPAFRNGIECPLIRHNNEDPEAICHAGSVHIAMTLDSAYLRGSIAAIYSVVKHATCPESIVFHFLVCDRDEKLQNLVKSTFPYLRFKVYYFDPNLVKDKISVSVRQDLEQPLNYARNYLAGILKPCIHKVIYLDSDLVVVDDIAELWKVDLGGSTLGAPEYCRANFSHYFTSAFWSNVTFANAFDRRRPCYFNTGVMVMDLLKWRQNNYTSRIEAWMEIQKATRIYELGSLPPFLLVFSGSVKAIDHKWNQHGLGGDNILGSCRSLHDGPVSLLHWSGKGKPWMRLDSGRPCPLDSLWSPYDLFIKEKGQV